MSHNSPGSGGRRHASNAGAAPIVPKADAAAGGREKPSTKVDRCAVGVGYPRDRALTSPSEYSTVVSAERGSRLKQTARCGEGLVGAVALLSPELSLSLRAVARGAVALRSALAASTPTTGFGSGACSGALSRGGLGASTSAPDRVGRGLVNLARTASNAAKAATQKPEAATLTAVASSWRRAAVTASVAARRAFRTHAAALAPPPDPGVGAPPRSDLFLPGVPGPARILVTRWIGGAAAWVATLVVLGGLTRRVRGDFCPSFHHY